MKNITHNSSRKYERHTKPVFVLMVVLSIAVRCMGQSGDINSIGAQFDSYNKQNPEEKIFVHTNKDFFVAGEILWFKVYAVGGQNMPATLSKVAYIEVLDHDKKPVLQGKIRLIAGSGNGSFQLPTSISSGNYTVRAYTNWMKNYSPEYYFSKPLTIINTFKSLDNIKPVNTDTAAYDIQFFPEGGSLVNGISCKVAFRIVDIHGKGVDCSGTITDNANNTIATFKPLKFGIGSFTFTPSSSNTYTAVVNVNGKTITQALPAVSAEGYAMQVSNNSDNQVSIAVTSIPKTYVPVYLLVHSGNKVATPQAKNLENGKLTFVIDKSQLGDGISHITLFNSAQQPVCERLYFKRPATNLIIDASAGQNEFATRGKINIDINTKDETEAALPADMSMSVYRLDSLQALDEQDIMSSLLLTADLKGTVESPAYYFTHNDAESNEALDNLMLTHGWSRFKWHDVLSNKQASFEFIPEYEGHLIRGKVINKKTGQPTENIMAYCSVPGKNFKLAVCKSDHDGNVIFNLRDFVGGDAIILQTNQLQDSIYRIDISSPFSEQFSSTQIPALYVAEDYQNLLLQHSINTQVQNAYATEATQQYFAVDVDTVPFYGKPSETYLLDDYTRFNTMEEVLREYVPGVAVRKHRDGFHLYNLDFAHNTFFDDEPLVLVDGVPFFNMDTVISINPLKIRKLDVMDTRYYLGPLTLPGLVSYTTYKGDLDGIPLDPASLVLEYDGMQLQREFYIPKYDTPKEQQSRLPDFRDALFWSPDVKTNASGKTEESFYTSDLTGRYAIVIQGITPTGKAGSKTIFINVK